MVDDYTVVRELGRGGMGVVYLARQKGLDRDVALKELIDTQAADLGLVQRFLAEAKLAGSISHPNVVVVYDTFEHQRKPYIAMEFVEGGSLRPYMKSLTVAQFGAVFEGLFAALSEAEARGIVHRDLKPENLLVTREGRVKVTDFGIAKAKDQLQATAMMTPAGATVGTPTYMAPEQAMAQEVGPWTDIYAAGIIAYEALAGRTPFPPTTSPMAMLFQHVNEPPIPLRSIREDIDPRLAAWVERLLAKEPAERTRSAQEAWESLEEILVDLYGPLWRRNARIGQDESVATPAPLTPAPFNDAAAATATTPPPLPGDTERDKLARAAAAATLPPTVTGPSWPEEQTPAPQPTPAPSWPQHHQQTPQPTWGVEQQPAYPTPNVPAPPFPQQDVAHTPPPPMPPGPAYPSQPAYAPGPAYAPPRRKSRTGLYVFLGVLGSIVAIFFALVIIGLVAGDDEPDDPPVVSEQPTAEPPVAETVAPEIATTETRYGTLTGPAFAGDGVASYTVRNTSGETIDADVFFLISEAQRQIKRFRAVSYQNVEGLRPGDEAQVRMVLDKDAQAILDEEGSLGVDVTFATLVGKSKSRIDVGQLTLTK